MLAQALAENPLLAHIYAEADGRIAHWSAGAERIFGHLAKHALGQRLDLVVPEELRALHWTGFNRTIGSRWRGSEAWGDIPGLHKDGRPLALQTFLLPLYGADERVRGVLASFRVAS
jgi:PAS domain S-box-containing protein